MRVLLGFLLGCTIAGAIHAAYWLGGNDMKNNIVYTCRDYGKFVIDPEGTWQINCVGPYNPLILIPEYKPWTDAEKKSTARFRK